MPSTRQSNSNRFLRSETRPGARRQSSGDGRLHRTWSEGAHTPPPRSNRVAARPAAPGASRIARARFPRRYDRSSTSRAVACGSPDRDSTDRECSKTAGTDEARPDQCLEARRRRADTSTRCRSTVLGAVRHNKAASYQNGLEPIEQNAPARPRWHKRTSRAICGCPPHPLLHTGGQGFRCRCWSGNDAPRGSGRGAVPGNCRSRR